MTRTNRVTLTGEITALEPLRHTPAGLPLQTLHVRHESVQQEAGRERKVACVVEAVAIGEVAHAMATSVTVGTMVAVEGFLGNKFRTGMQLILHITNFNIQSQV